MTEYEKKRVEGIKTECLAMKTDQFTDAGTKAVFAMLCSEFLWLVDLVERLDKNNPKE